MRLRIWMGVALALAASAASSQELFKSTMPDGKVIYGQKPESGAKQVDKVPPPPPKSGMTTLTPQEKARGERLNQQQRATATPAPAAKNELEAALKQLEQAQAARKSGEEPLPGERIGTVKGASRLKEEYFARQAALEKAEQDAKKRVDELQSKR